MKLHAQWIVGFVDGEGCFAVNVIERPNHKIGKQLRPELTVGQHKIDIQVLYALKEYFGCGHVYESTDKKGCTMACWRVVKLKHLIDYVIPFFDKHQLKTKKAIEFQRFRHLCLLMEQKVHLSSRENFKKCVDLAEHLRVKPKATTPIDEGRVQLLPTNTQPGSV